MKPEPLASGRGEQPSSGQGSGSLGRRSATLAATSAVTALSGLVYWVLAAKLSEPAPVGAASAAWSAIALASIAGSAGAVPSLVALLPSHRESRKLLALVLAGASGLSFVLLLPVMAWFVPSIESTQNIWLVCGTAAGAALLGAGLCIDAALIHASREAVVLLRALVVGGGKCALVIHWHDSFDELLAALIIPLVLGALLTAPVAFRSLSPATAKEKHSGRSHGQVSRAAAKRIGLNHAATVALATPTLLLPLVAVTVWGAAAYAPFFPAWVIASTYMAAATAVGAAFLSHRSHGHGGRLRDDPAMRVLGLLCGTVPLATVAYIVAAPLIAAEYASAPMTALLPIMASIPFSVVTVAAADALRARQRLPLATVYSVLGGLVSTGASAAAAASGPSSLAYVYLASQVVAAFAGATLVLRTRPNVAC